MLVDDALENLPLDALLGGDEARRHDDRAPALRRKRIEQVLNEAEEYLHRGLVGVDLLRRVGNTGPEADRVLCDGLAFLREVELERRIGDAEVERAERAVWIAVAGLQEGIALHHVLDRRREIVQDQVQAEHLRGLLRDVLRVDGASVLTDLMRKSHEERSGAGGRIVAGHAAKILVPTDKKPRHDLRNRARRVVFRILAAAVLVIVLDQMLEHRGEEVVLLGEHRLEVRLRIGDVAHEGAGELVAFRGVVDRPGDERVVEDGDLRLGVRGDGEDVGVEGGDLAQGRIEEDGEIALLHRVVEVGDCLVRTEPRRGWRKVGEQVLHLVLRERVVCGIPLIGGLEAVAVVRNVLRLVAELVVEVLVQEHLDDDLVLVAVVAEAEAAARLLERVDEFLSGLFNHVHRSKLLFSMRLYPARS